MVTKTGDAGSIEEELLNQCASVAHGVSSDACSQVEANVYRVAAMLVAPRYPDAGRNLMQAANAYFEQHPDERLDSAEAVRRGWIIGLPRMRNRLERSLNRWISG